MSMIGFIVLMIIGVIVTGVGLFAAVMLQLFSFRGSASDNPMWIVFIIGLVIMVVTWLNKPFAIVANMT